MIRKKTSVSQTTWPFTWFSMSDSSLHCSIFYIKPKIRFSLYQKRTIILEPEIISGKETNPQYHLLPEPKTQGKLVKGITNFRNVSSLPILTTKID